jgi:hypothetical protein
MENLVPDLKKKDLANMTPDERDDCVLLSEELTVDWIHAFLDEVYRVEDFFKGKQNELINSFIGLQDKFRIKTDQHEIGSEKTSSIKNKKQAPLKNFNLNLSSNSVNIEPQSPSFTQRTQNMDPGGMSSPLPGFEKSRASGLSTRKSNLNFNVMDSSDSSLLFRMPSELISSHSSVIPLSTRYRNLEDLQNYYNGEQLTSYIVPEMK